MTVNDYLNLITSAYRSAPKFTAMVEADVSVQVRVQDLVSSMIPLFDVDAAVGGQLDIIGEWVGVSRNVNIPIENVYFTWDGDYTLGWEYGVWQGDLTPTAVTVLPDDAYRRLIKARIAANKWDGTTDGAYAVWDSVFTEYTILIQDYQDMSYSLAIVGGIVDSLTLALLRGGYLPLKPEGVRINEYLVPVDDSTLFGWDVESDYLAGWDDGSWARELSPTI
jgi:hypothetical protein